MVHLQLQQCIFFFNELNFLGYFYAFQVFVISIKLLMHNHGWQKVTKYLEIGRKSQQHCNWRGTTAAHPLAICICCTGW